MRKERGTQFCVLIVCLLPLQPQGRSFAELDLLFEKGVSARKFATTRVDVFVDLDDVDGKEVNEEKEKE